jgi:hypothetical protein
MKNFVAFGLWEELAVDADLHLAETPFKSSFENVSEYDVREWIGNEA